MQSDEKRSIAEEIRAFNRFYTEAIGSLDDEHEGLDISLAQSRMLFTIASIDDAQVGQLADALRLDLAYTSRILGTLEEAGLLRRTISPHDRRQRTVALTATGRRLLGRIEKRSNARVLGLISHLDVRETKRLLASMNTIRSLINKETTSGEPD